jgi:hypothetical protein
MHKMNPKYIFGETVPFSVLFQFTPHSCTGTTGVFFLGKYVHGLMSFFLFALFPQRTDVAHAEHSGGDKRRG